MNSIATKLAGAITADTNLQSIRVSAAAVLPTTSSQVVNISSTSQNTTTYTRSLSGGATETITSLRQLESHRPLTTISMN